MPDRALSHAFGSIAEFLKLQRSNRHETKDRAQDAEKHAAMLALNEANIGNVNANAGHTRVLTEYEPKKFDLSVNTTAGQMIRDNAPGSLVEKTMGSPLAPDAKQILQAGQARQKVADETAVHGRDTAQHGVTTAKNTAASSGYNADLLGGKAEAAKLIADGKAGDPRTDQNAARTYAIAGIPINLTTEEAHRQAVQLASIGGQYALQGIAMRGQQDVDAGLRETPRGFQDRRGFVTAQSALNAVQNNIAGQLKRLQQIDNIIADNTVVIGSKARMPNVAWKSGPDAANVGVNERDARNIIEAQKIERQRVHTEANALADSIRNNPESVGATTPEAQAWLKSQLNGIMLAIPKAPIGGVPTPAVTSAAPAGRALPPPPG